MRTVRLVLSGVVALGLAACTSSPQTKRAQAIYDARERSTRYIDARPAIELAQAIHAAYTEGDYTSNYAQLQSDVLSAQYALERATIDGAMSTPEVLAWRGVMYEDSGRITEAREEYRKSVELAPSFLPGVKLIPIYGTYRDPDSIIAICKATYAVLTDVNEQVTLIRTCKIELSKLVPEEQTLAWLDPKSADWYKRDLARREAIALDEQELQRQQTEHATRVAQYVQRCSGPCHTTGVKCQNACTPGDTACNRTCETTYDRCVDDCEAGAKKLERPRSEQGTKRPTTRSAGPAPRSP